MRKNILVNKCGLLALFFVVLSSDISLFRNVNDNLIVGKWIGVFFFFWLFIAFTALSSVFDKENRLKLSFSNISLVILSVNSIVVLHCICQMSGLLVSNNGFAVTADFDNPAGVSTTIVLSFPFALFLCRNAKNRIRKAIILFVAYLLLLYFMQSRMGVISLFACFTLFLSENKLQKKQIVIIAIIMLLVVVSLVVLFVHKTESTMGRLIIYNSTFNMIKDSPLVGHGIGGFRKLYMYYQADYLNTLSDSSLLLLTDNVNNPLCEYLIVVVNYGIIGLLILFTIVLFYIKYFLLKCSNEVRSVGMMTLTSLFCLSLFSYPFRYPISLIVIMIIICISIQDNKTRQLVKKQYISLYLFIMYSLAFCLLIYWYRAQVEWYKISERTICSKPTSKDIDAYDNILRVLKGDPFFLYNDAVACYDIGLFTKSKYLAEKSLDIYANYDTEILLGKICEEMGQYEESINYYDRAFDMCPSKIMPLYNKFLLYKRINNIEQMKIIGKRILEKPIKVHNSVVRSIRIEVRQELVNYN